MSRHRTDRRGIRLVAVGGLLGVLAASLTAAPAQAAGITVSTWSEFSTAFADGSTASYTITLAQDLTGTERPTIPANANRTVDLNGNQLDLTGFGINAPPGTTLIVDDTAVGGGGELTATSSVNAGIGGNGFQAAGAITIEAGTITATGGTNSAGIGGGASGGGSDTIVTINGGTVIASSATGGAGIGGGATPAWGGSVVVNGGDVTSTGGMGGAGIGGGGQGAGGTITINGGTIDSTGGAGASGIGGGYAGRPGAVTIAGGSVSAAGGKDNNHAGAGIGTGGGAVVGDWAPAGTVAISGGQVDAVGTAADVGNATSAGIGGGSASAAPAVTISGGTVTATGGVKTGNLAFNASGIGSGSGSANAGSLTVSGYQLPGSATTGGAGGASGGATPTAVFATSGTVWASISKDGSTPATTGQATIQFQAGDSTIAYDSGAHGTVSGCHPTTYVHGVGATPVCTTVTPDAGYLFDRFDPVSIDTSATGDRTVTAIWKARPTQTVTITSTAPGDATVGGPSYTPNATASSGLTQFSYTASPPQVCTLDAGAVKFVGAGTCEVKAMQAGNADWQPGESAVQAITVVGVPGAPLAVTGKQELGLVTVSWSPPSDDGGSPVTGYTVYQSTNSATGFAPVTGCTAVTGTSCRIPGLATVTGYFFKVAAGNAVGAGPPSVVSGQLTTAPAPVAPVTSATQVSFGAGGGSIVVPAGSGVTAVFYRTKLKGGTDYNPWQQVADLSQIAIPVNARTGTWVQVYTLGTGGQSPTVLLLVQASGISFETSERGDVRGCAMPALKSMTYLPSNRARIVLAGGTKKCIQVRGRAAPGKRYQPWSTISTRTIKSVKLRPGKVGKLQIRSGRRTATVALFIPQVLK